MTHEARDIADAKGIIIADTKFEYGIFNGELIIIDECMPPDSTIIHQPLFRMHIPHSSRTGEYRSHRRHWQPRPVHRAR